MRSTASALLTFPPLQCRIKFHPYSLTKPGLASNQCFSALASSESCWGVLDFLLPGHFLRWKYGPETPEWLNFGVNFQGTAKPSLLYGSLLCCLAGNGRQEMAISGSRKYQLCCREACGTVCFANPGGQGGSDLQFYMHVNRKQEWATPKLPPLSALLYQPRPVQTNPACHLPLSPGRNAC